MLDVKKINEFINDYGFVTIADICETFSISESTARRVLARLAAEKVIVRFRGGAISASKSKNGLEVSSKKIINFGVKKKIAQAASKIIPEEASVMLLGGTTIQALCPFIKSRRLTVITSNMLVFNELKDRPNINLIILGGAYNRKEAELSGSFLDVSIKQLRADYLFMSAFSFDEKCGFIIANYFNELYFNCINACEITSVLIDSSKYKKGGVSIAASPEMVDYVFTDSGVPESAVKVLKDKGVNIIQCDAD